MNVYEPISDERREALAKITLDARERDLRPFRFEDLPLNYEGKRIEPKSWGPKYSKPAKPGRKVDVDCWPTNCASGQKYTFDAVKHRAKIRAKFIAAANADRLRWATSKAIVRAYEEAMRAKRAREAAMFDRAA